MLSAIPEEGLLQTEDNIKYFSCIFNHSWRLLLELLLDGVFLVPACIKYATIIQNKNMDNHFHFPP